MKFRKMHGLGNDFVIFDAREENIVLTPDDMALIADRRWGVGCDQLVIIDESENHDIAAYFFNSDGSEGGSCGNATRCVADIIMSETGKDSCSIEVTYGVLTAKKKGDLLVEIDMGAAKSLADMDLSRAEVGNPVAVNVGNPHLVFFVEDFKDLDMEKIGSHFEDHDAFPNRTNVEFVKIIDKKHLRQKTWERGVGMTEACGSGACAVALAAQHRGFIADHVEIELDGGVLNMEITEDKHVLMTGMVAYVFDGVLAGG